MTREEKIIQERQEIEGILMYFAENKLDNSNLGTYKEIEKCITNVFRLEIEEMGYELDINGNNSKNGFNLDIKIDSNDTRGGSCSPARIIDNGQLQQIKPSIMYNLYTMCRGVDSDNKEIRLTTIKKMFKTVFHELQHHRQECMAASNVSSKEAIGFARDFTLHRYLSREFYTGDGKTGNYTKLLIENNANEIGYNQYLEILGHSDSEVSKLRDIETGKSNTNQYKIDVNSFDNKSHYKTNGLEERMDATIPIIDDLIMNRGFTEILELYPILLKEYNLDGTKKSTVDLIMNMEEESREILQMKGLSEKEKITLIKDGQEMYYELIYRTIEKSSPNKLKETKLQIGEEQFKQTLNKMEQYFQNEMERKIAKSATMASAQSRDDKSFIAPSNDGTIQMMVDGKEKTLNVDDFIQMIDPKLMQKQFNTPKGVFNAPDFIKKYCFQYLAQDGIMTLKDGQQMSAKEFVEEYMLQKMQLSMDYPPRKYIEDTVQSENPWEIHQKTRDRLVDYYEGKKKVLREASELDIKDIGKEKDVQSKIVRLTQDQQTKKMDWIAEFLYDSIKNPIENDEILRELIEFYKTNENPKKNIYDKLVTSKDSREFNEEKYKKDYEELIVKPTIEELYKNIGTRIGLNEDVFGNNSSILEKVFKECPTYEEFREKLEKSFSETQKNTLKKCSWIFNTPKEKFNEDNLTYDQQGWYDEVKQFFSDEEIYSLAPYIQLEKRMHDYLKVSENVMGFHVNAEKQMDLNRKNEKNEIKFYINAGDDTCKVASLFRDKCKKAEMNYYFKVINPYKDRLDRADRLCIYSEMKHVQDFFNILQEIKQENPQIEFEKPPMMVGKFDDWLGIASDYSEEKYAGTSYNVAMSNIYMRVLNKIFEENKEKGIKENDLQDAELIEQLKEEMILEAQKNGYSKEKICIKPSAKSILKKIDTSKTKQRHKTGILQMQNVISSVKKANIGISEIKNIMEKIKESISRSLRKHKNHTRIEESKSNNIPTEQIKLKNDER